MLRIGTEISGIKLEGMYITKYVYKVNVIIGLLIS